MVESTRLGRFCQVRNALPLQQRQQECQICNILHLVAVNVTDTYRISSIRRRGYDLLRCPFCAARAAFISLENPETSTTAG